MMHWVSTSRKGGVDVLHDLLAPEATVRNRDTHLIDLPTHHSRLLTTRANRVSLLRPRGIDGLYVFARAPVAVCCGDIDFGSGQNAGIQPNESKVPAVDGLQGKVLGAVRVAPVLLVGGGDISLICKARPRSMTSGRNAVASCQHRVGTTTSQPAEPPLGVDRRLPSGSKSS